MPENLQKRVPFLATRQGRRGRGEIILAGYFGRRSDMMVHHLKEMSPECGTQAVPKEDRVYFTPDTLDNAKEKGFTPCKLCIKN